MARYIVFDARFANDSGLGQMVDADLRVDIYAAGATTPTEQRVLVPSDNTVGIVEGSDANGVFYTTRVDVTNYVPGSVRVSWYARLNGTPAIPYPFTEILPYPPADTLSPDAITDYVRTYLGFPAVAVELTSAHYNIILDETLSLYNEYIPHEKFSVVELITGRTRYPMPNLPARGPFDVTFIRKEGIPMISDPMFGREFSRNTIISFDEYVIGISFWESLRRVTSQEPEWVWSEHDKTLYINIGGSDFSGDSGNYHTMVRYFDNVHLESVRPNHFNWFRRYALSQGKKILGRIRNKFSGAVPSPSGTIVLDGADLLREGQEEERDLREKIRRMAPSIPPVRG